MPGVGSTPFSGLTPGWAEDVAIQFARFAPANVSALDDVWVSDDLALLVRYRLRDERLAVRFGRLDVDPTSLREPEDSAQLASLLVHNLHASTEKEWADMDGYRWWGDRPDGGWPGVLSANRLLTVC